jgi:Plasmid pRiA4b ORF-3-like protein
VPLSRFGFRPTERFLYEYDFTDGWQVEVRVEKVIDEAPSEDTLIPMCMAGREPGPPDGSGGPRIYAERRLDAIGWHLTEDMKTVGPCGRRSPQGEVPHDPDGHSSRLP